MKTLTTLLTSVSLCLYAAPIVAQGLDDVHTLISLDVLDGGTGSSGQLRGAFRMQLAQGWKTYWRAPGDAGIPPLFHFDGSENLANIEFIWPTPAVFDQNGIASIGYANELILPVMLTPRNSNQPVRLKGLVELGICSDVCIPGTLIFDAEVTPDAGPHPLIAAAIAARPYTASEANVTATRCHLRPTAHGLRLTAKIDMPPAGSNETVIIESGNPQVWASETHSTRNGNQIAASVELTHNNGGVFALDRSTVRITVLGTDYAVDIQGCKS